MSSHLNVSRCLAATVFRLAACVSVAGVLAGSGPGSRAALDDAYADSRAQPNVLIIVTDDQRVGTLEVMSKTRHWFRDGGRRFPHANVTTPLCCPSRTSILTGLFAHNHGVHRNATSGVPQRLMLQRHLTDADYQSGIIGKFLNGWRVRWNPPYFDRWATTRGSPGYFNVRFNVNGTVRTVPGYATRFMAKKAVSFLRGFERHDSRPWFLYVATYAPHRPSLPEPRFAGVPVPAWNAPPAVFEADRSDKPPWVRAKHASPARAARTRADQLRALLSVDQLVGAVFRELGALDERRDTLAILLSDNGFMWGEHGLMGKRVPYMAAVRVPLFLRWPGHVKAASIDHRNVTNVDLAPTVMAAAGLTPPSPMDGRSLFEDWRRPRVFTEYWRIPDHPLVPGWEAIRTRRLHYVQYYDPSRRKVIFRELYRLSEDPWELHNLLHDGNSRNDPPTRWLQRLIRRYAACAGVTCP
jgi:arylsulfatase A-like enzyme